MIFLVGVAAAVAFAGSVVGAAGFAVGAGGGASRLHERGGAVLSRRVLRGAAVILVLLSVDAFVQAAAPL